MDINQPLENFLKPRAPSPRPLFSITLRHPEALGRLWGYLSQFCSEFTLDITPAQTSSSTALLAALKPFFRRQERLSTPQSAAKTTLRAHFLFPPAVKVLLGFSPQANEETDKNLQKLIVWAGASQVFRWKDSGAGQALLDTSAFDPTQVRIKGFLQLLGIPFEVQE